LPPQQRDDALAQVPTLRRRSDDELRRSAMGAVRRSWVAAEMRQAMESKADLGDALYGDEAVDAFLSAGEGHLVVSPKSMLGYRLDAHARDVLLGIATHVLRHIRTTASAQLGADVRSAVMGRPVRFRSSMQEAGGEQALEILTDAALAAGFAAIEFLEEPAAAAYDYHRRSREIRRTMILDIGGGTTDMALALVGGDAPDRKSTRLNSSHVKISYAVFCLKKKKRNEGTNCEFKARVGDEVPLRDNRVE